MQAGSRPCKFQTNPLDFNGTDDAFLQLIILDDPADEPPSGQLEILDTTTFETLGLGSFTQSSVSHN